MGVNPLDISRSFIVQSTIHWLGVRLMAKTKRLTDDEKQEAILEVRAAMKSTKDLRLHEAGTNLQTYRRLMQQES